MNNDEQDIALRNIERKQDFIMERLGYNPHTMQPHGNGLLGRIEKQEKQLEALKPAKLLKQMAILCSSLMALFTFIAFVMEYIKS
jgi:hypothetical protein